MTDFVDLARATERFPTLTQSAPHVSRSDRYHVISTAGVLQSLEAEGFAISDVTEMRTRDAARVGFQKHLVRLRRFDAPTAGEGAPEVCLLNSHDGSAGWVLFAGFIRFACANGLIFGDAFLSQRVRHSGDVTGKVIDATYRVVSDFGAVAASIDAMRATMLTADDREEFATRALAIRYPDPDKAPVTAHMLLTPRRVSDGGADLWRTYNVVQENMIRGGASQIGIGANGRARRRTMRRITGIDANVSTNRELHALASSYIRAA